jgi:hypothetical protein
VDLIGKGHSIILSGWRRNIAMLARAPSFGKPADAR